ncbi:MAG: SPASM domain-containing protein, partial [bacterium]
ATARQAIDFALTHTPPDEKIDIGFFGGEPLLEFGLLQQFTDEIERHPAYDPKRVVLSLVSNGTIFSDEIAEYLKSRQINLGISCDGPPEVQDRYRVFADGRPSGALVERNIRRALAALPRVMVNAVYRPDTFLTLPETVEYFFDLGVRQLSLNPDFTAGWSNADLLVLPDIIERVGRIYLNRHLNDQPCFLNLIDFKVAVILRGGYHAKERCRMGKGEFAFSPEGNIFPCERLIGDGSDNEHCIGNIHTGFRFEKLGCHQAPGEDVNQECQECGIKDYCMNWCGCSNMMSTGYYNRVSPFLCASEKATISTAFQVFQQLEEKKGATFISHLVGCES